MALAQFSVKPTLGYLSIVFLGLVLGFFVHWEARTQEQGAIEKFRVASHDHSFIVAKTLEDAFKQAYQNIRTISFLPSVRAIDRYGKTLDQNALQSIQQIYNNLASNVSVSEVYVVPSDLDGDRIDANTGAPEFPILMFDQLLIAAAPATADGAEAEGGLAQEEIEAVEIYEYRLMKAQNAYFAENYPKFKIDEALNTPMIGGGDVITCDNSDFLSTKNDADRTGIILSVPFYAPDDSFKGLISTVILNNALRDMLPAQHYALFNNAYQFIQLSKDDGQQTASLASIKAGIVDDSLLYSEILEIKTTDPRASWKLWVGLPNSDFYESAGYASVRNFEIGGYGFSILLTFIASGILWFIRRSFRVAHETNAQLEKRVTERTNEVELLAREQDKQRQKGEEDRKLGLQKIAQAFDEHTRDIVQKLVDSGVVLSGASEQMVRSFGAVSHASHEVSEAAEMADKNVQTVAAATEELTASAREISMQVAAVATRSNEAASGADRTSKSISDLDQLAQSIGGVVGAIKDIADQTNLLALNATIEAARAGEAGKGFAVVADEVKKLAMETALKTEEINKQVTDIQQAVKSSIDAVQAILLDVQQIDEAASMVSSAVEEQNAATSEISRNVVVASSETQRVTQNIQDVNKSTVEAEKSVVSVSNAAQSLNDVTKQLEERIAEFLSTIRNG